MNDETLRSYIVSQPIPDRLWRDLHRAHDLSPGERRILQLLADGLSRPEIAKRTGWALDTVCTYDRMIHLKLGVRTAAQAVAIGIRSGLIA